MFFLYAKRATKQIYQIYVGSGFNFKPNPGSGDVSDLHATRATLNSLPVNAIKNVDWPAAWKANYNDAMACKNSKPFSLTCGILQITIDMKDQDDLDLKPKNGLCLPKTFCLSADGATGEGPCQCALTTDDPLYKANPGIQGECQRTCKVWAVRDLDFPPAWPLGFSFKMPNDPDGQSLAHRPVPEFFPTDADGIPPDWSTEFANTTTVPDKASGGTCFYPKLPGTAACPMPTVAPTP
jgi:hypothetical protein